jgi:hypothetical protein
MESWEIEARLLIQKAMNDYGRCVDTGRIELLAELFTEPCHYDMGTDAVLESHAAILERGELIKQQFRDAPNFGGRVRHHITPVSVQFLSETQAKATSYFLTMGKSGPDHWGVYRDLLVRTDDAWLFQRRVVTVEGHSESSHAAQQTLRK